MDLIANIEDTIVAIASSHDVAGQQGIVRVSGPGVTAVVANCFQSSEDSLQLGAIKTAQRIEGAIDLPQLGQVPCALYLWPTERSYTRQPTAELHTYGALPILQGLVEQICQAGARLAEPGEFTLRSFLSGRIDLAQAEAVLGVIDAANQREVQVALTQLAGGLSQPLTKLRDCLINLVADLEAGLDFVDEDIEFITAEQVLTELDAASETIGRTLEQMGERAGSSQLPRVVLYGEPNVGKSSLWNAMIEEGQALVDAISGTTRDYLVGTVTAPDGDFLLIDTAGVEKAQDAMQVTMREMGDAQVSTANLILLCIDSSRPLTDWERQQLATRDARAIVVGTKCDLLEPLSEEFDAMIDLETRHDDAATIRRLAELCAERLNSLAGESAVVANTASRCRESLRLADEAIRRARQIVLADAGDELTVSELRTSLDQLGLVVGAIYTDDILDRVFSRFCIGK